MRITFWKCCVWGLPLSLLATALMGAEAAKTTNARSANRVVSRAATNDSDEELFDTHLISRSQQLVEEQTPPPAPAAVPMPGCTDIMYPGCGQTPFNSSATQSPNAPWNNLNTPPSSAMPNNSFGGLSAGQGILTAQADAPTFLGDFFGGPALTGSSSFNGNSEGFDPIFTRGDGRGASNVPIGSLSGNAGVLKIAEGTSPLPRDRVFLGYNYFDNVALTPNGIGVNRITPGFEKTFFDRNASVEVRVPMAWTLNSTVPINSNTGAVGYGTNDFELGNVTIFTKFILAKSDNFVLTAGSGVSIPTADDTKVTDQTGRNRLVLKNDAVHLLPFLGAIYTPSEAWFTQGLLQIDVATRGHEVLIDGAHAGRLNDSTFLFASIGTGYWLHRDTDSNSFLTGLAPIAELHLNQGLQNLDSLTYVSQNSGTTTLGLPGAGKVQTLNAVVGVTSQIQHDKTLTLGYVVPLGGGSDTVFDGEFRLLFNWYFGGRLNRMSRVQF